MNMMGFIWLGFGKKSFCKNRISGGGLKILSNLNPTFFLIHACSKYTKKLQNSIKSF